MIANWAQQDTKKAWSIKDELKTSDHGIYIRQGSK